MRASDVWYRTLLDCTRQEALRQGLPRDVPKTSQEGFSIKDNPSLKLYISYALQTSTVPPCHGEPDAIGAGHLECQVATAAFRSPATSNFRGRSSGRGNIHRSTRRSDRSHGEPDAIGAGPLECQVATAASSSPSRFKGFGRNCMLTLTRLLGARTRICCHGTRQRRASVSKAFASRCTSHYRGRSCGSLQQIRRCRAAKFSMSALRACARS